MEVYQASPTWKRPPEATGEIIYLIWFGHALGFFQEQLEIAAGEEDIWSALLSLLPLEDNFG